MADKWPADPFPKHALSSIEGGHGSTESDHRAVYLRFVCERGPRAGAARGDGVAGGGDRALVRSGGDRRRHELWTGDRRGHRAVRGLRPPLLGGLARLPQRQAGDPTRVEFERPYLPLLLEPVTIPKDVAYWLEGSQWI